MQSTATPNIVAVSNNCTTGPNVINQNINIGTAAAPSMVYIKGDYDPDSLFRGLAVDGSQPITGYGILVVEDSDLAFFQTGQFRWNGIVLVTGRNNSTASSATATPQIRGALIVNETNPREERLLRVRGQTNGTMKILASKENIDRAPTGALQQRISAFREN